ncbi:MAG TPA: 2-C-methyl-D-erythritol 4-phosphate cytidylyltransferase [Candidatus Omnitrophota bacterium]|nr:2-C-methyl-D-erythritol 4-phosphate cytidylyltransferase [Candidatus Omnitrophota bacterium]
MKLAVVVPSAGKGRRLKSKVAKPLVKIAGVPLVVRTLRNLLSSSSPTEAVLAVEPSQVKKMRGLLDRHGLSGVRVVAGGKTRSASVQNGLLALSDRPDWVMVHDAARPFVTKKMVRGLMALARRSGGAIVAVPATATVKRVGPNDPVILRTEDRRTLYLAQTPQVFKRKLLVDRYRALGAKALQATDEAALFDGTNIKVRIFMGTGQNIKITTPEDLKYAEYLLKGNRK